MTQIFLNQTNIAIETDQTTHAQSRVVGCCTLKGMRQRQEGEPYILRFRNQVA